MQLAGDKHDTGTSGGSTSGGTKSMASLRQRLDELAGGGGTRQSAAKPLLRAGRAECAPGVTRASPA